MTKDLDSEQLAQLMEDNMGLVVQVVNSFKPQSSYEQDEFLQLGRIALWKAIQTYSPEKSKLATYIWNYVRWEILRHLAKEDKQKVGLQIVDSVYDDGKKIYNLWEFIPDTLTKRERKVLELKLEGHTFISIGEELGYSRGWINKIFKSAINKINEANNEEKETNLNVQ